MYATLLIPSRFNGPAGSGNGGYCAGAMAEAFLAGSPGAVQVTLRRPPPLETPMLLTEDRTSCIAGGATVMEARSFGDEIEAVEPVSYDEAAEAETRYAGHLSHPFPGCFSCGTQRPDGLHIFPGLVDETRVATTWTPDRSLSESDAVGLPVTWAALDCTGGWACSDLDGERPLVLGRMACVVDVPPSIGEPHVVIGRRTAIEGRKNYTLATLYDSDGRVVARASHTWIAVDPSAFAPEGAAAGPA